MKSKTKNRVVVERAGCLYNVRRYHLSCQLGLSHTEWQSLVRPLRVNSTLDRLAPTLQSCVRQLFEIDAINKVEIHPTCIHIEIGKAFEWDVVEPRLKQIFAVRFFDNDAYEFVGLETEKPLIVSANKWTPAMLAHPMLNA